VAVYVVAGVHSIVCVYVSRARVCTSTVNDSHLLCISSAHCIQSALDISNLEDVNGDITL